MSLGRRDPDRCGTKFCRGERLPGRWVCSACAPLMDRLRAELAAERKGGRIVRRTRVKAPEPSDL